MEMKVTIPSKVNLSIGRNQMVHHKLYVSTDGNSTIIYALSSNQNGCIMAFSHVYLPYVLHEDDAAALKVIEAPPGTTVTLKQ